MTNIMTIPKTSWRLIIINSKPLQFGVPNSHGNCGCDKFPVDIHNVCLLRYLILFLLSHQEGRLHCSNPSVDSVHSNQNLWLLIHPKDLRLSTPPSLRSNMYLELISTTFSIPFMTIDDIVCLGSNNYRITLFE